MKKFEVEDRVYHRRNGDPFALQGYGNILEIGPIKAKLTWEESGKEGGVEVRDLITDEEAGKEGLT